MLCHDSRLVPSPIDLDEKAETVELLMHFICQTDEQFGKTIKALRVKTYTWQFALSLYNAYDKYQIH